MRIWTIALSVSLALGGNLHRIRQNDRCGFADSSEAVVIAPQYSDCGDFAEGLAPVRVEDKWGYVDEKGETAIAPRFEAAESFSEGLAFVTLEGDAKAVVDKTGKVLFPANYYQHGQFHEGLARVRVVTHWKCFQAADIRDVDDPADCPAQNLQAWDDDWGYIDKAGALVLPAQFRNAEDFSEGLAREARGFIDHQGSPAINANFTEATSFSGGLAAVQQDFNKWGYIDKHGTWVVEPSFEKAEAFREGRALVKLDGKFGFVDSKGALAVPARFDEALSFSEGLAAVRESAKWGYIDPSGKAVIPLRYASAQSFTDGLATVSGDSHLLTIDKKGETVSSKPPTLAQTFERLQSFEAGPLSFLDSIGPLLTLYKEQLRELVTKTLGDMQDAEAGPDAVRAEIVRRLKGAGIRFSTDPEKETRPYGVIDKVEVVRPGQHPELLSVIFDFNFADYIDSAFSLFGRRQSGWELLLRDSHISTPNPEISWAYTWHVATPEFTPNEKDGSFVMLLWSESDHSADGYHGIEVELRRFDGTLRNHRIFYRLFSGKNQQLGLDPDALRVEVAAFTHDPARGGTRPYPYRYRIKGDEVTRTAPIAFDAHDFVEEWTSIPWEEAAVWSDPANLENVRQWHDKNFEFGEMSVEVCDTKRTMWQIAIAQSDDDSLYFTVKQTGKWDFVMKSVSDKPTDGCTNFEPEETDWRQLPTMFDQPTTE